MAEGDQGITIVMGKRVLQMPRQQPKTTTITHQLGPALVVAAHNHPEVGPQTRALVGPHWQQTRGTSDPQ